jgi:hypothetical protein
MKVDGRYISDDERMKLHADMEQEEQANQRQLNEPEAERVPPPIEADKVEEVERLCAADLIMTMRRMREQSRGWSEITREQFARRYEQLALEAAAAAAYLRRHRASDELPDFLRANGAA